MPCEEKHLFFPFLLHKQYYFSENTEKRHKRWDSEEILQWFVGLE